MVTSPWIYHQQQHSQRIDTDDEAYSSPKKVPEKIVRQTNFLEIVGLNVAHGEMQRRDILLLSTY
jgi:hypothetical protein